jgi:hypothetical protein
MGFPRIGTGWKWVRHTIIILILAGIPSFISVQLHASEVDLYIISPFWQYASGSYGMGFSFAVYPVGFLLFAVISAPSYLLLFVRGRISKSTSILRYSISMAALTILAGYSVIPIWQNASALMMGISYGVWESLGWYSSLVMIYLIFFPSVNWELSRYISGIRETALEGNQAIHAFGRCNPERFGHLLFYMAILAPYAYQNMSRNPIIFGSVFYTVDFGSSPYSSYLSFIGYTIPFTVLIMATTALRLLFVYEVLMFTLGKAKDRDVVVIGLLSLVSDTFLMPQVFLEVSFITGPFPLLFATGLLIMYKCFSTSEVPLANQAR